MVIASTGFDAYLDGISDDILNLKFNETARATIIGYPESFDVIVYALAHKYSLKGFTMEECLVRYGLNRLFNDELSSFGLGKKVDILNKIKRHILLPSSKKNKLEVFHESCSVCKRRISLSEQTISLVAHVGSLLDMGISDLMMLSIIISLNESAFVMKEFYWFKKDFYLEREKRGLKITKEKASLMRSKLILYEKKITQLYNSYMLKLSWEKIEDKLPIEDYEKITDIEKEELKDLIILKSEMHDLRLVRR